MSPSKGAMSVRGVSPVKGKSVHMDVKRTLDTKSTRSGIMKSAGGASDVGSVAGG